MAKQTSKNNMVHSAEAPSAPKNIFLHLFTFVALYISAVSFGSLVFGYIDRWFPDRLAPYLYNEGFSSSLRWSIASLIIVYPLYLFALRYLKQEFLRHPALEQSRIRKWLTYFTLFVAAVVIVTDLVTLLYNFLGGEISSRFILKVLAVLFIAGVIFAYYLFDIRGKAIPNVRVFAGVVSALVLFSVLYGFFIVGSPQTQRLRRFDQERSQHLQQIYYQVRNFWDMRLGLPATLEDIKKLDAFAQIPVDPETDAPYPYRIFTENSFELCATFSLPSGSDGESTYKFTPPPARDPFNPYGDSDKVLTHTEGNNCFDFTLERVPKEMRDVLQ
ncbi:MAG: DUF5671 domain-containing protein [bacterium]|nr:DUF5671 domain-containing protein [bacterium]